MQICNTLSVIFRVKSVLHVNLKTSSKILFHLVASLKTSFAQAANKKNNVTNLALYQLLYI